MGDGLKTGDRGEADLTLRDGGRLRVTPRTIVRFQAAPPNRRREGRTPVLSVEAGEVELLATSEAQRFHTELGVARIEAGGRVRFGASERRKTLRLEVGRATLETPGGAVHPLPVGKTLALSIGEAELEPIEEHPSEPSPPPDAAPPDAGATDAASDAAGASPNARLRVLRGTARLRVPGEDAPRTLRRRDGEQAIPTGTEVTLRGRALLLRPEGELALKEGSAIRSGLEGDELLRGSLRLRGQGGDSDPVHLLVPGGIVAASGEASVRRRRGATEVRAQQGSVRLEGRNRSVRLSPGEVARIREDGRLDLPERSVERFHLVLSAGERATVRMARLPIAVGFRVPSSCEGTASVEVLRGRRTTARAHGEGVVGLRLGGGSHRYRLRCGDGKVAAEGKLRIVRDAGRAPLPRTPPSTLLDVDGRRYVVLYQNLLPEIVVRWRDAPEASRYVLHVESGTKERSFPVNAPRTTLRSGILPEGKYTLRFEAAGQASPSTPLRIVFDNAATVASLRSPSDGSFAPGDTVQVRGVALRGWSVSVEGVPLPLDEQSRFQAHVQVAPERLGLAVRMAHPTRGVQYYVRRARVR